MFLELDMTMTYEIEQAIKQSLPDAKVEVSTHDDIHFSAIVIANSFANKTRVMQHQEVYRALQETFGVNWSDKIHALELKTLTGE
jgi:acid stress-induced BolA-like protein IbaG/YrbA